MLPASLAILLLVAAPHGALGLSVESTVTTVLSTATYTVEGTYYSTLSSECTEIKTLLGLQYSNSSSADVSKLTLDYVSNTTKTTYNLSTAATELPKVLNLTANLTLFLHGFLSSPEASSFEEFSDAFLASGQNYVLAVDSSSMIGYFYLRASTYVVYIGELLGDVLAALYNEGLNNTSIYLVGHSLGAHIAGYAGKRFYNNTGKHIGRITGLDPAGPCFTSLNSSMRLNSTDAIFVDIIHTNAGVYGLMEDLGQVDVYANDGSQQPGCAVQSCSHGRVVDLYISSITQPKLFPAASCSSWSQFQAGNCSSNTTLMGLGCTSASSGRYYLRTSTTSPYGLGRDGLSFTATNSTTSTNTTTTTNTTSSSSTN